MAELTINADDVRNALNEFAASYEPGNAERVEVGRREARRAHHEEQQVLERDHRMRSVGHGELVMPQRLAVAPLVAKHVGHQGVRAAEAGLAGEDPLDAARRLVKLVEHEMDPAQQHQRVLAHERADRAQDGLALAAAGDYDWPVLLRGVGHMAYAAMLFFGPRHALAFAGVASPRWLRLATLTLSIAYVVGDIPRRDIWLMDADGKNPRALTRGELDNVGLVILDLMLPGVYGMDILKQIRATSDVPVLVLSARISGE